MPTEYLYHKLEYVARNDTLYLYNLSIASGNLSFIEMEFGSLNIISIPLDFFNFFF